MLRALTAIAEPYGTIHTAKSGREAIDLMKTNSFDLIITDYEMAHGNGMAVATFVSETNKSSPIIMVTGHGTKDLAIKALNKQVFSFVEKPVSAIILKQVIERAIRKKNNGDMQSKFADLGEIAVELVDEMANPIKAIECAIDEIKSSTPDMGTESKLDLLKSEAKKIQEAIEQTRLHLKLDSKKLTISTFDLLESLDEVKIQVLSSLIKNKTILLFSKNTVTKVRGDKLLISQALFSLIKRSIENVSLLDERWVSVDVRTEKNAQLLVITNSSKPSVEQVENEDISDPTSFGVILAKNIIDCHKGKIIVDANDKNSRLIISLPAA